MNIAITNQKGGTGKTTTAVNLAGALGDLGRRVLLVDMDPQANATLHVGLLAEDIDDTIWTCMQQVGQPVPTPSAQEDLRAILDTMWEVHSFDPVRVPIICRPNSNPFDVIPSNLELSEADLVLASTAGRERRLATVLGSKQAQYEYILIDCPPHLGVLTLNALTAADVVLIPLEAAYFASKGMNQLFRVLLQVKQTLNHRLSVLGVLITRVDQQAIHSRQIAAEARKAVSKRVRVFATEIPISIDLADASAAGKCVTRFAPQSRGAEAYRQLAEEIEGITHG